MEPQEKEKIASPKIETRTVETFAEDMAAAIGDNQDGMVKNIIRQEEKNEEEKARMSLGSKENKFFLIMGSILILATFGLVIFSMLKKQTESLSVEKPFTPLIFTDKSVYVEVAGLKKDKIVEAVLNAEHSADVNGGEVEGIYLTENKKVIGLRRFIELVSGTLVLPQNIPGSDIYIDDNFLLGIYNNSFFILMKMNAMSDIFASLKQWENKMFADLYQFFGINLSSDTQYLLTKNFENGIVSNKNARILYKSGIENSDNITMMYVFANNHSVVVTDKESTAHEIILRLASSQIKK